MFIVEGQQAEAAIREQSEMSAIIGHLATAGYSAALRSMLQAACNVAGLSSQPRSFDVMLTARAFRAPEVPAAVSGDVLFKDCAAYILQPMGSRLHAWEIRPHSVGSGLTAFCAAVQNAAAATLDGRRLRGMDFSWKPVKERPARRMPVRGRFYQEAKLDTRAPDYTTDEAQAARLLVASAARSLLLRLAQVGKARSIDAATDADAAVSAPLLDLGLLRREYLVQCRQDSHTICAIQVRAEIETGGAAGFRCTICGRPFRDELVQEIFALTEAAKRLLTGSRWMTIWVTELLIASGIDPQQIAWNAVAGEDELDIMTDALGPRAFFELKDREFGLGDAYPFAYRVTRYGGSFGIVVSMERVAEEAKRFFSEQRPAMGVRVETLEGPAGIESGVPNVVDRISRTGVTQLLLEVEDSLGLNTVPLVQAWMERIALERATSNTALHQTAEPPSIK